jgi:dihydroorotate dehydrogenase
MYKRLLKPLLFLFDPEHVHDFFIRFGKILGATALGRWVVYKSCYYENPMLETTVCGVKFKNPIGLAAGFDKDIELTNIMPSVGFGYMEVGAVTRHPYGGNKGLRLARLPDDKSLIVYYGLKSIGAEKIEKKLQKLKFFSPVGINIAKTNRADICGDKSASDYAETYKMLGKYFSYVTINVSCPNAQDGCTFQEPAMLDSLLSAISKEEKTCPVFLKLSTHLTEQEIDSIIEVVEKYKAIDGFVMGNLSKRRDILDMKSTQDKLDLIPAGGISGAPVRELSTQAIRYIYKKTSGKYVIIGLGGVFTAEDAYEKIKAGASLVQVITGLIYEGPTVVKAINKGLVRLLAKDGYMHISEAIGKE